MKTKLTLDLESTLYQYCLDNDAYAVEEVSMPDDQGIVDTLSYKELAPGNIEWRCYELKVTKNDFHSTAKLSFVGHFNYFVLTPELYQEVQDEIPANVGVLTYRPYDAELAADAEYPPLAPGYLTIEKTARRRDLQVPEDELISAFIASMGREVNKAKRMATGIDQFSTEKLYKALKRRNQHYQIYDPEANLYDRFIDDMQSSAVTALQEEIDALNEDVFQLKLALKKARDAGA
ncbi:hypothetical protein [Levilactobacillus bambusae]|uniref:Uncharacterized protein n=1 Tax=Levilactobacillus bambusae TaxID=2024736 RepID=A0A2V1N143_9LACO|nr:hypothetical protein [Levilactobacillus bambusae]PWG00096.1 hypothetical protein DCM90_03945 [Levilactobacillus bambusae]